MPAPLRPQLQQRRIAFGRRVRNLREARDLTQQELAERAGLDRKTVNRMDVAQIAADLDLIFLTAEALQVPSAVLFVEDIALPR